MKISIITAVFNRQATIVESVASVATQVHPHLEHVVVDGASTDGTLELLAQVKYPAMRLSSERDSGVYDALNKGFSLSSGDIVGLMHSDDIYADSYVLSDVAKAFEDPTVDVVYGDLDYVFQSDTRRIVRHWVAGTFVERKLKHGWMPPHPTMFMRRSVMERLGGYDTSYRIAADYDAVLRLFTQMKVKVAYINRVLVKMRVGGMSNGSLANVVRKSAEDLQALRKNGVGGTKTLFFKNVSKLAQFFQREAYAVDRRRSPMPRVRSEKDYRRLAEQIVVARGKEPVAAEA
jgi:glycosyltransferase